MKQAALKVVAWPRMIALVELNAFFASIEQLEHPELRKHPVVITHDDKGNGIISCSDEAKARGVCTGMRLREARLLCPGLIRMTARSAYYASISNRVVNALRERVCTDIEVFSQDEIFIDLTRVQHLYTSVQDAATWIGQVIDVAVHLGCSIGIAGDKTTAKWAAKHQNPLGITVIPPEEASVRLNDVPVTALSGLGLGIGRFLASRGVRTCGQMNGLPIGELTRRWGNVGRRVWLMAQGMDPEPVRTNLSAPQNIGSGTDLPQATTDTRLVLNGLEQMAQTVASRLRRHHLEAQQFFIGLKTDTGWVGGRYLTVEPTDDARPLIVLCRQLMHDHWMGQSANKIQLTALDPGPVAAQFDLFAGQESLDEKGLSRTPGDDMHRFGTWWGGSVPFRGI